ncbi:UDP-glucose 6-dehydrogenase [Candidatus Marinamargulisbacteria bacterium SCGC AG-439-L15]|nr:UDP-glucose 6-dehydrogenase [Candidatus Marinamargulisbacteria bacterium SCGC AG-439-L15]
MISVFGLGFVGLTTALGFAEKGFKTYGIDNDIERLDNLRNFVLPFSEPGLLEPLKKRSGDSFFLTDDYQVAIQDSAIIFLCVGTPSKDDGAADLSFIFQVIDQILSVETLNEQVIVLKSTVPPSTLSTKVLPYVQEKSKECNRNIILASNPEFLREGYCWDDFTKPDRIVIGLENDSARHIFETLYKPFNAPIYYVSFTTAEFIKYLSNTLLSTLISYSNEMSMLASSIGDINIQDAFKILQEDKRWFGNPAPMKSYVHPGCGYGGYCLPKDTMALSKTGELYGYETKILNANLEVNESVKNFLWNNACGEISDGDKIGILGLSFKPESDDVRFSPAKEIIELIQKDQDFEVYAYDPLANQAFKKAYPHLKINYCDSLDDVLAVSDHTFLLTAWEEFKDNADRIKSKSVFDFRYFL